MEIQISTLRAVHDQLLLLEGVCRQLGIIAYHEDVEKWRGGKSRKPPASSDQPMSSTEAIVLVVRVNLVQSVRTLAAVP